VSAAAVSRATRPGPAPAAASRKAMVAKVHIARKELALDEGTYRAVLRRVTGSESTAACTDAQLEAAIAEFRRLGWKPKAGAKRGRSAKPYVRMIYGIWGDLKPYLADGSEDALRAFVQRQTKSRLTPQGISAPEFLDGPQANRVIEGLKAWLAREKHRAGEA